MPGLDGIGVLRALRDGRAEPVPVVVVSAFSPAHGARAVDALAEGAFDLVAKPALGERLESSPPSSAGRSRRRGARGRRPRAAAPRRAAARPLAAAPPAARTGTPRSS